MELFAPGAEVVRLESLLHNTDDASRPGLQLALAWQLRQRDPARALALAAALGAGLHAMPPPEADAVRARLQLIRAEDRHLQGAPDEARTQAEAALARFAALGDAVGQGDALLLLTNVSRNQGDFAAAEVTTLAAIALFDAAGDTLRAEYMRLARINATVHNNLPLALQMHHDLTGMLQHTQHPAISALQHANDAVMAALNGQGIASRIGQMCRAMDDFLASGQTFGGIQEALNIGACFNALNDLDAALTWLERALEMARDAGWKRLIGRSLVLIGDVSRKLGRLDAAVSLLDQAMPLLQAGTRNQAIAFHCLADARLAMGHYAEALHWFTNADDLYQAIGTPPAGDLLAAQLGQARATHRLHRLDEAGALAEGVLRRAQQGRHHSTQVSTLCLLAEIEQSRALAAPPGPAPASTSAALPLLQQALQLAQSIQDYAAPVELLESLAAEHARLGDTATAYALALDAGQARERMQSTAASNRALSLQVQHDTERLKLQAAHLLELSRAEAHRADVLTQANATLELLGRIGRDLTTCRDTAQVYVALQGHVQALLQAQAVVLLRLNAAARALDLAFGVEADQPVDDIRIPLDDPNSLNARCAREGTNLAVNIDAQGKPVPQAEGGRRATQTLLYAPLVAGEQMLGVITVQSPPGTLYGAREQAIFHSLCAHAAVALANTDAQAQLQQHNLALARQSPVDPLTGLVNRGHLEMLLEREFARQARHGTVFSLVLLDLDHFEQTDAQHGRVATDQLLCTVAQALLGRVRKSDVAGRWGASEFLVVCPEAAAAPALVVAESVRQLIERRDFGPLGAQTVSVGVATAQASDILQSLIDRAEQALQVAQVGGRNRVVTVDAAA